MLCAEALRALEAAAPVVVRRPAPVSEPSVDESVDSSHCDGAAASRLAQATDPGTIRLSSARQLPSR